MDTQAENFDLAEKFINYAARLLDAPLQDGQTFEKVMQSTKNKQAIVDFCYSSKGKTVIKVQKCSSQASNDLKFDYNFLDLEPKELNLSRSCFIYKLFDGDLQQESLENQLFGVKVCGDLLKFLSTLIRDVYADIPKGMIKQAFPGVLKDEFSVKHCMLAVILQNINNFLENKIDADFPGKIFDEDLQPIKKKELLEEIVYKWIKYSNEAIRENFWFRPKDDENFWKNPLIEIKYWKFKQKCLTVLKERLENNDIRSLEAGLAFEGNPCTHSIEMLKDFTTAVHKETSNIVLNLDPLRPWLEAILDKSFEFLKTPDVFENIIQLLAKAWANSKEYRKTCRLIPLFRAIMGILLERIKGFIFEEVSFTMILKKDYQEVLCRIEYSIQMAKKLILFIEEEFGKISIDPLTVEKEVDTMENIIDSGVSSLKRFIELSEAMQQYIKFMVHLEESKQLYFEGRCGSSVRSMLEVILNKIESAPQEVESSCAKIFDSPQGQMASFKWGFRELKSALEGQLEYTINVAVRTCLPINQKLYLLEKLTVFLDYPAIKQIIEGAYHSLLNELKEHLQKLQIGVKKKLDTILNESNTTMNIKEREEKIIALLQWIDFAVSKTDIPFDKLNDIESHMQRHNLNSTENSENIFAASKELSNKLISLKVDCVKSCQQCLESNFEKALQQKVFYKAKNPKLLSVNYQIITPKLFSLLNLRGATNISEEHNLGISKEFLQKVNKLTNTAAMIENFLTAFTKMQTSLECPEMIILEEASQNINQNIHEKLLKFFWNNERIEEEITVALDQVLEHQKRILCIQEKFSKIKDLISKWKPVPELCNIQSNKDSPNRIAEIYFEEFQKWELESNASWDIIFNMVLECASEAQIDLVKAELENWSKFVELIEQELVQVLRCCVLTWLKNVLVYFGGGKIDEPFFKNFHGKQREIWHFKIFCEYSKIRLAPEFEGLASQNGFGDIIATIMNQTLNYFKNIPKLGRIINETYCSAIFLEDIQVAEKNIYERLEVIRVTIGTEIKTFDDYVYINDQNFLEDIKQKIYSSECDEKRWQKNALAKSNPPFLANYAASLTTIPNIDRILKVEKELDKQLQKIQRTCPKKKSISTFILDGTPVIAAIVEQIETAKKLIWDRLQTSFLANVEATTEFSNQIKTFLQLNYETSNKQDLLKFIETTENLDNLKWIISNEINILKEIRDFLALSGKGFSDKEEEHIILRGWDPEDSVTKSSLLIQVNDVLIQKLKSFQNFANGTEVAAILDDKSEKKEPKPPTEFVEGRYLMMVQRANEILVLLSEIRDISPLLRSHDLLIVQALEELILQQDLLPVKAFLRILKKTKQCLMDSMDPKDWQILKELLMEVAHQWENLKKEVAERSTIKATNPLETKTTAQEG